MVTVGGSNLPPHPRWQFELQHLVSISGREKQERSGVEKVLLPLFRRFFGKSFPFLAAREAGKHFSQAH